MSSEFEVCVVGQNEIVREGLRHILEANSDFSVSAFDMTGIASTNLERLLLLEVPTSVRISAFVRAIRSDHNPKWVIAMPEQCEIDSVVAAFDGGADGVLAKSVGAEPLIASINLVRVGGKVIPSHLVSSLGKTVATPPTWMLTEDRLKSLSEKEIIILRGVVAGFSTKVIARSFKIAEATAKAHIRSILRKLQVENRTQAAVYAYEHGIAPASDLDKCRSAYPA